MKIKSKGSQLTCWVNGIQMIDLVNDQFGARQAAILLQIPIGRGVKVMFRDLKI